MTEAEWNTSTDADEMLAFVADRDAPPGAIVPPILLSERKLRLFLIACCRRQREWFTDPRCQQALEVAGRFADMLCGEARLNTTAWNALQAATDARDRAKGDPDRDPWVLAASAAARVCEIPARWLVWRGAYSGNLTYEECIDPHDRRIEAGRLLWDMATVVADRDFDFTGTDVQGPTYEDRLRGEGMAQAHLLRCVAGNPFRPVRAEPGWRTAPVVGIAESVYAERAFDRLPILADALEDAGCTDAEILTHCRAHSEHARGCWVVDMLLGKE
jgi:hypothetical protein